jgi:polyisoprenoid-binding protein YceI
MKKVFHSLVVFIAGFFLFALPAQANTEDYTLDSTHAYVLWHVSHFGFSDLSGKWLASGHIELDEKAPQNSKVNVSIALADLVTGIPKLDKHLKSADFFNVAAFSTATFVSDKVEMLTPNTAKIYGVLSLHNISKPIVLEAKLNKFGIHPMTHKKTAGFTATTQLKRSDFGVGLYAPNVGDEVKIEIQLEAYKTSL